MTKIKLLYFIFFLFCCQSIYAQKVSDPFITVDFKNATVNEFVTALESKSSYHFYYDSTIMDSLRITFKADQKNLIYILEGSLKNTNYYYAIGQNSSVFLTKNEPLKTDLAILYFNQTPDNKATDSLFKTETALTNENKANTAATTENKIYEIGIKTNEIKSGMATIAGYLRNFKTGEPIYGASILSMNSKIGTFSDRVGFYSLTLPKGNNTLQIKAVNLGETRRQLVIYNDGKFNIDLKEKIVTLKTVQISSQKNNNLKSVEMGVNKLDIKSIKQVPSVFGEPDILRVVLTLPGVQSVGEASTGFNVRGGAADQNLILLDESTIYNPSHFFGFFSAFNPEIVDNVELYKSSIPEKFGGRLSSVLEVTNREGNKKKYTGSAGIGLITSRLNIEGPIDSNKTSFILGARTTYSNWLLKLLPKDYKNSSASFTDINLGISHQINEKNSIIFSGYYSTDRFKLNSDTAYSYGNKNASIKWKHIFNPKLTGSLVAGFDKYNYNIKSENNEVNAYNLSFDIGQTNLKADFNYLLNDKHTVNFGLSSIYYTLHPGEFLPVGEKSLIKPDVVPTEQALESAVYVGDKFDITKELSISGGLRYSLFNFLGPYDVRTYVEGQPKTENTLVSTESFGRNKVIKTYHGPEIRLSARYNVSNSFSVKAAFNTLRQYIHLISNTTAISPTDIYKLSDPNIKPQFGNQISLGLYKNFSDNAIETSVEVYYKKIKDYLDYKSGASLVLNHHIETDVINTKGKAYGVEFFVRKNVGNLNGWMSYAYSRTLLKDDDITSIEKINAGNYYAANFDKPHAFNFIGNYRISHRVSFSLNLTYSTGRPITLPISKYYYAGAQRVYYSDRNAYRIPDYFRSDISFNIEGNHKLKQLTHGSWTAGIYNITGRKNAFSTYFTEQAGVIKGYKLSIFATVLPFVNYNIKF
ncbi:TonB-dependent receptor plug domain-containing protein [Pedobacter sp. LMG 31464]|uniref:TonB-dependent receptor plug domain-containing protein n=1 Tax=Pedobacter planticolens TaxID=2679964 RepID=A0A923DXR6_9SPHI|nr:carboxypeptidase-like regulatory domain-containing protein [Pedobacter planticolens]MBB2144743.1 TonB-dependent receptor plug domain-containing protein [Pedobacter planticolens]